MLTSCELAAQAPGKAPQARIALDRACKRIARHLRRRENPAFGGQRQQRVVDCQFYIAPFALIGFVADAETIDRTAFLATAPDILEEQEFAGTCRYQFVIRNRAELDRRSCVAVKLADDGAYGPANIEKAKLAQFLPFASPSPKRVLKKRRTFSSANGSLIPICRKR